jgi:DNA-binding GntR family transcriptional regulator
MTMTSISAERTQLRDEAAAYIREAILSGQAQPSMLLRLGPVAEHLGMSITPVREAFLLLAQSGWVVQEPNRGFRVAQFKEQDVQDSYFVNEIVAGELAARAALVIDDSTVSVLEDLDAQIRSVGNDDSGSAQRLNREIHRVIYDTADAPRLKFFVEASSLFVPRQFWGMIDGWLEHNRTGHAKIIWALANHDSQASRRLMEEHIEHAAQLLINYLKARGFFANNGQ